MFRHIHRKCSHIKGDFCHKEELGYRSIILSFLKWEVIQVPVLFSFIELLEVILPFLFCLKFYSYSKFYFCLLLFISSRLSCGLLKFTQVSWISEIFLKYILKSVEINEVFWNFSKSVQVTAVKLARQLWNIEIFFGGIVWWSFGGR